MTIRNTRANGFIRDVQYEDGALSLPSPGVLFDEDAGQPARAPDFGEHTDEVLSEAGFSMTDIAAYRRAGVIA